MPRPHLAADFPQSTCYKTASNVWYSTGAKSVPNKCTFCTTRAASGKPKVDRFYGLCVARVIDGVVASKCSTCSAYGHQCSAKGTNWASGAEDNSNNLPPTGPKPERNLPAQAQAPAPAVGGGAVSLGEGGDPEPEDPENNSDLIESGLEAFRVAETQFKAARTSLGGKRDKVLARMRQSQDQIRQHENQIRQSEADIRQFERELSDVDGQIRHVEGLIAQVSGVQQQQPVREPEAEIDEEGVGKMEGIEKSENIGKR